MTRLRSAVASLAVAAALLIGIPTAFAAPPPITQDNITIYQVSGGGNGTSGPLSVGLSAPTGITSVSAELVPAAGGSTIDAGHLGFLAGSGSLTGGTWQTAGPIVASPGGYTVKLSAADSGGDSFTDFAAGTVSYLIQPLVTITADRSTADFDHQTVIISGTVDGTWPDGSTGPLAGQSLQIREEACCGASLVSIHTTTDGSYQYALQFVPLDQTVDVQSEVPGSATVADTSSPEYPITVLPDPVQVTAGAAPAVVSSGGVVTVTGTASYQPQGKSGYARAPNIPVEIELPGQSGEAAATGTTKSDGSYSLSFSPAAGGTYDVYAGDLPEGTGTYPVSGYFTGSPAAVRVTVRDPVSFGSWQAQLTAADQLSTSACLIPAAASAGPVTVQYAASASGPWSSLGSMLAQDSEPDCSVSGTPGILVAGTLAVPLATGYYRAAFPGSSTLPAGHQRSSDCPEPCHSDLLACIGQRTRRAVCIGVRYSLSGRQSATDGAVLRRTARPVAQPWCDAGHVKPTILQRCWHRRHDCDCYLPCPAGRCLLPRQLRWQHRVAAGNEHSGEGVANPHPDHQPDGPPRPRAARRQAHGPGRLWQYVRGWKAYRGRGVEIIFSFARQHKWYFVSVPRTNRSGWFQATFADPGSAHWSAQYAGDRTHYASTARAVIYVPVRTGSSG